MKSILVLSHTHGLTPVAARLKQEGATVEWCPWKWRYEAAWEGALPTPLKGERKRDSDSLRSLIELAESGDTTVLHDHPRWGELFVGAKDVWGTRPVVGDPSPVRACGWWDGEHLHAPHLLVVDLGAWPGGLGAAVEGGATLVRGWEGLVRSVWAPYLDALKSCGHRGLVQAHLGHRFDVVHWSGGWQGLHPTAFLANLDRSLEAVLDGAVPGLDMAYAVVVPVTVPPWPVQCDRPSQQVEVLVTKELAVKAAWHDSRMREGKLEVAGLDGYLAVAKGTAHSFVLARQRALGVADAIKVPQKQLRPDVGGSVERVLAACEVAGWAP